VHCNIIALDICLRAAWLHTAADIRRFSNPLWARLQWIWRHPARRLWHNNQICWKCAEGRNKAVSWFCKLWIYLKCSTYA